MSVGHSFTKAANMNPRNPTVALFAIAAIACLVNATQPIGDRFSQFMHQEVGENYSGRALFIATRHHWRRDESETVQLLYHFGTKSLAIDCSSTHCLVVLSNAGEA
jgi:hypothetical protein